MATRFLQLDDVRNTNTPDRIAALFQSLGYNVILGSAQEIGVEDLELPARSSEATGEVYLVADHAQGNERLQVLLFRLEPSEWEAPSIASGRMKAIAKALSNRPSNFLLIATDAEYGRILLINPHKQEVSTGEYKVSIRKLLIDRSNPTAYDRDRLDAIAAHGLSPNQIYQKHCEAFDVEKLTKVFYTGYRSLFERVQGVILNHNSSPYFQDRDRLHQFSQRLLGRIMFLYFLQKKEFLAEDRRFLTMRYRAMRPDPEDFDYYAEVLEPLFFETLNCQRPNLASPWGKIPYLNGGLFDRDYGPGIRDAAGRITPEQVTLPNHLFDPGATDSILGFFNSYNFTITENVAGDEDVAVDPEMLGKVFENMLAADERGKSGTFYTPRGIVQFMCTEVLSRYLADASGMTPDAIRELMELDADAPDSDFNQRLTRDQARVLKEALNSLKVLDPAVGSGAFPLGMMQTILAVRQAIGRREGMTIQRGSLALSQWKRDIIANNLYGVDIKPGAIEIAKLRMWLSLVVDIPAMEDVEPLPNLDYKLMCGDSLISTIHGETIIPDPSKTQQGMLVVTPIQQAIQPLLDLQHQYFSAQSEERHALRAQILEAEANVFRVAVADRVQYLKDRRRDVDRKIKTKASKALEKEKAELAAKLADLEQFAAEVEAGDRSLNFFNYHLHFRDVFEEKGGFDCVIGNPPYVRQEAFKELKSSLEAEFDCYKGTADLLVYFYERGLKLLQEGGYLTYITSNKYMRAGYGDKLRKFLVQHTIEHIIDFGDADVFEAIAYPSIILVRRDQSPEHQIQALNWEPGGSLEEFDKTFRTQSFLIQQKELTADGWQLVSPSVFRLMEKLRAAGTPLGEYVEGRFYRGIVTGLNEAFVVNRETRDRLIAEHSSSEEILKPFIRGRDVKRWCVDYQDLWLIFTRQGTIIDNYPAIKGHLNLYRSKLEKRLNVTRDGDEWFQIPYAIAYWQEFEKPKIILGIFMNSAKFAFDLLQGYTNNSLHIISDANLITLSILNSNVGWWFLRSICTDLQNGYLQAYIRNIEQIPIPKAPEPDRLAIEALAQKCLDSKGVGCQEWETEIDDRVAHLYGLTVEDMKIIRGE